MTHREADAKACGEGPQDGPGDVAGDAKKIESRRRRAEQPRPLAAATGPRHRETQQYIEQNRSRIELEEKNDSVRGEIAREAQNKEQVQQKLADSSTSSTSSARSSA